MNGDLKQNALSPEAFARVNVVGTSGSGKSTFAKRLAECLGQPYVEMDALFWEPNWQQPSDEVFFARVKAALDQPTWVLDGNYDRTLAIKWERVTAVVWLDYSFSRTLLQALKRAVGRIVSRQEIWPGTGNRESFSKTFLSRESILIWTIKTHGRFRDRYAKRLSDPPRESIHFFRLRSPREAEELLAKIEGALRPDAREASS